MDKERFFALNKCIRTGERVRVLLDLLLECIESGEAGDKPKFFEAVKAAINKEQEAIREMSAAALKGEKKPRKEKASKMPLKVTDLIREEVDNQGVDLDTGDPVSVSD